MSTQRLLSSVRMQARVEYREKAAALDKRLPAFDRVELIVSYLYESLTAYEARRREIRTRSSLPGCEPRTITGAGEMV